MPTQNRPKLLGIAGSLRNARWGMGNKELVESIKQIKSEEQLYAFLAEESELHLNNFIEAGRKEGKPFLEIYKNLKSQKGNKGLSNSEVALAAALWAAHTKNVDIDHISLSEYFTATGRSRKIGELKEMILAADGLLISGPVYFGDRGSLVHDLIEMIRHDPEMHEQVKGKLYGGIAVGAKRNGGQETTLIYQMLDMVALGFDAVGNDSDTTSQYGGTGLAGDVGSMHKDQYGLNTSMGTGRRMGNLLRRRSYNREINGPVNVAFLILQESENIAKRGIEDLLKHCDGKIAPTIVDISTKNIIRCLACDICPTDIDIDEVYRCIITSEQDDFEALHPSLLDYDAIIPVAVSVHNTDKVTSNYQTFVERTRYLRRGDYVFSDMLTAPLTFEEIGVREHYSIRMLTSMIRHHTVMTKPMIGHLHNGELLNKEQFFAEFNDFVSSAHRLTSARLAEIDAEETVKYNPVGYVLSADKDKEDERLQKRKSMTEDRKAKMIKQAKERLKPNEALV